MTTKLVMIFLFLSADKMTVTFETSMTTNSFYNTSLGDRILDNVTDWPSKEDFSIISPDSARRNTARALMRVRSANQNDDWFILVIMYMTQIVIPVGLVLNMICVAGFVKSKLARTPTAIKVISLAIVRIINLIALFAQSSAGSRFIGIPNLAAINNVTCAGALYLGTFGGIFTGWLMSAAAVERFCYVTFPLKVKAWNLYRKSKIMISVLLVVSLALPVYHFWCFHLRIIDHVGLRFCLREPKMPNEFCVVCSTASHIISSMIPAFTILVFSILMGIGLYTSRADRQEMGGNNKNNMEFRITVMLLIEATVFMIVRLPLVVLVPLHQVQGPNHPVIGDALRFCAFLIPLNHSTSFFVYVGLLPEFRQSIAKMMKPLIRCCPCGTGSKKLEPPIGLSEYVSKTDFSTLNVIGNEQNSVADPGFPRWAGTSHWVWAKNPLFGKISAKNCMKMKEVGLRGGTRP